MYLYSAVQAQGHRGLYVVDLERNKRVPGWGGRARRVVVGLYLARGHASWRAGLAHGSARAR